MDILLAQSHMKLPNEGIPHGNDFYPWAFNPVVICGNNPTQAGLPAWWTDAVYPTYPRVLSWFTIYRESGTPATKNSRVNVGSLQLYIKSKATGLWASIDNEVNPEGYDYQEVVKQAVAGSSQVRNVRTEADGTISLRPPKDFWGHGWGKFHNIDVTDIGGVYVRLDHRVIADDPTQPDSRLMDKWLLNVGVDYYPPEGSIPMVAPGCIGGRFLRSCPDWRTSMAVC